MFNKKSSRYPFSRGRKQKSLMGTTIKGVVAAGVVGTLGSALFHNLRRNK